MDDVAKKFSQLKAIVRPAYMNLSEIEFLTELGKYSDQDIEDVFQE